MAAQTKCENLSNFRKRIREAFLRGNEFTTIQLVLLSINRYLSDPKHRSQIGIKDGEQSTVLDVIVLTIGDGKHKVKVVLAPALNQLVQKSKLEVGQLIVITSCKVHYNETDLENGSLVIIDKLHVTGYTNRQDILTQLSWADECSQVEKLDVPLTSSRGYFTSVWSSIQMYGDVWKTQAPVEADLSDEQAKNISFIKDLAKFSRVVSDEPFLLVRVLMKSRILHYGKTSKNDKWPFQAHMLVGDKTGACTAVLWNAMCPNMYYSIKEGMLLLLGKFKTKKSFQVLPRFKAALTDTQLYDVDVNLNSHHPVSEVKVIDESRLPDTVDAPPPLKYHLVSRKQSGSLPDTFKCDIVGVVMFVGRYEREAMYNKFGTDSGGFWVKRWIQLMDNSSNTPFFVQMYSVAEGMEDLDIHPGTLLLCTHMRIVNNTPHLQNSAAVRCMFLTTSAESQIIVVDANMYRALKSEPLVKSAWQWIKTTRCKNMLAQACIGGYINCLPLPNTPDLLRAFFKERQILASSDWESVVKGLKYRESQQILIKASMVHVRLTYPQHNAVTASTSSSPSKRSRQSECEEVVLDSVVHEDMGSLPRLGRPHLHEDISCPILYQAHQWSTVKQIHAFPRTQLDVGHDVVTSDVADFEFKKEAYYTVTWAGLNTKVVLQSHLLAPHSLTKTSSFTDLLQGTCHSDATPRHSQPEIEPLLSRILASANACADKRFLVALDCHQGDVKNTEIMVNRALVL